MTSSNGDNQPRGITFYASIKRGDPRIKWAGDKASVEKDETITLQLKSDLSEAELERLALAGCGDETVIVHVS